MICIPVSSSTPQNLASVLTVGGDAEGKNISDLGTVGVTGVTMNSGFAVHDYLGDPIAHLNNPGDFRFDTQVVVPTACAQVVRGYDGAALSITTEGSSPLTLGAYSSVLTGNVIDVALPTTFRSFLALASINTTSTPGTAVGQVVYSTSSNTLKTWNGSSWI